MLGVVAVLAGLAYFVITLVIGNSLNRLWSMMNALQLFVHTPLFNTRMPANAIFFVSLLLPVATFNPPPLSMLPQIFDVPAKEAYNLAFWECGYGSMYSIVNYGTCFLLLNVWTLSACFWAICSVLKKRYSWAEKCFKKCGELLFWNSLIRLLFEGYLQMFLSVFVNITDMDWSGEMVNGAVLYNNIFTILVATLLSGLPFYILIFYWRRIDRLEDVEFQETYGGIYDGLALTQEKG